MTYHELLRAASRGCRLQVRSSNYGWLTVRTLPSKDAAAYWRVDPRDSHLDYGIVSSYIKSMTAKPPFSLGSFNCHGFEVDWPASIWTAWEDYSKLQKSLYLMLLAEQLKDSGL